MLILFHQEVRSLFSPLEPRWTFVTDLTKNEVEVMPPDLQGKVITKPATTHFSLKACNLGGLNPNLRSLATWRLLRRDCGGTIQGRENS